jgi:hypothetical protein
MKGDQNLLEEKTVQLKHKTPTYDENDILNVYPNSYLKRHIKLLFCACQANIKPVCDEIRIRTHTDMQAERRCRARFAKRLINRTRKSPGETEEISNPPQGRRVGCGESSCACGARVCRSRERSSHLFFGRRQWRVVECARRWFHTAAFTPSLSHDELAILVYCLRSVY